MTHKCIYQICEYAFATKQFQKYALCGLIFENTPFACNRSWRSLGESCSVWGRGLETIKKARKQETSKQKEQRKTKNKQKHPIRQKISQTTINQIKQSAKKEQKQTETFNQAKKQSNHHQSSQTVSKERKKQTRRRNLILKN